MTATPERQSAPTDDDGTPNWADQSGIRNVRGKAWWSAVVIAVLPTAAGIVLDLLLWSKPWLLFTAAYFVACVLAVLLVRRKSVFGPMVQPPLVLAITMPLVVLLSGNGIPAGSGMTAKVLAVASPLINGFPVMALATLTTVGIGLFRMYVRERHPKTAGSDATTKVTQRSRPKPSGAKGMPKETGGDPRSTAAKKSGSAPPPGRPDRRDPAAERRNPNPPVRRDAGPVRRDSGPVRRDSGPVRRDSGPVRRGQPPAMPPPNQPGPPRQPPGRGRPPAPPERGGEPPRGRPPRR